MTKFVVKFAPRSVIFNVELVSVSRSQHVNHSLVGRHHDSSVWNLSDQLRGQASVNALDALFLEHQGQSLPEPVVLEPFFAQPSPGHFVRISHARGHCLRHSTGHHELQEVARMFRVVVCPVVDQLGFDGFVQHEVHDGLGYAHVRSGDALVKPEYALQF